MRALRKTKRLLQRGAPQVRAEDQEKKWSLITMTLIIQKRKELEEDQKLKKKLQERW